MPGGRKKAKDTKLVAKKKRGAASSEDETRTEPTAAKAPKATKKQKVIQEKDTRKNQKVNSCSFHPNTFRLLVRLTTHSCRFKTFYLLFSSAVCFYSNAIAYIVEFDSWLWFRISNFCFICELLVILSGIEIPI